MTHFVGLVVAETEAKIAAIVQPFHEYECTGVDDQYVVDVDRTAEALEEYGSATARRLKRPDGMLLDPYDAEFYRDPTLEEEKIMGPIPGHGGNGTFSWWGKDWGDGRGYRGKVQFIPEGWELIEVRTKDVEPFATWACGWFGLKETRDPAQWREPQGYVHATDTDHVVAVVDRTNPNKKWDWWTVGGRWANIIPGNACLAEDVGRYFTEYIPSAIVDADGWHAAKDWGWFGASAPTDEPDVVREKLAEHVGKRVWVVDFHI